MRARTPVPCEGTPEPGPVVRRNRRGRGNQRDKLAAGPECRAHRLLPPADGFASPPNLWEIRRADFFCPPSFAEVGRVHLQCFAGRRFSEMQRNRKSGRTAPSRWRAPPGRARRRLRDQFEGFWFPQFLSLGNFAKYTWRNEENPRGPELNDMMCVT